MMKKFIISLSVFLFLWAFSFAQDEPGFEIIPGASNSDIWQTVVDVWKWWEVWDRYKDTAYWTVTTGSDGKRDRAGWNLSLWDQFASGIMTWDTILDYVVYLIKFLWQLALLAWALMIIYYGYKKATEHLKFGWTLGKVVIWILVISFAYVIVKIIWSMFIS